MIDLRPPITRFAPSPTGFLHIGGVRTAIFNWLYAKANGGSFLVRIEDTDKPRSTPEAVDAIFDGLAWMGLTADRPAIFQSERLERHIRVVHELLARGRAYKCYCTAEELDVMRARAVELGLPRAYDGTWRDRNPKEAPKGRAPVIRFKAIQEGTSTLEDAVQGPVTRPNENADDLIIVRAGGTPTYNMSVVVDDHDMGVTHVIRGDDHLNNAFRQKQIYEALEWDVPVFAHIPLIHGFDGAKLSKRHGALGIETYRNQGYLPEGLFSYLLKLGWSCGDEDVITRAKALDLFDLSGIGKSPSRLDPTKLKSVNKAIQDALDPQELLKLSLKFAPDDIQNHMSSEIRDRLQKAAPSLQERATTLQDFVAQYRFFTTEPPIPIDEKAQNALSEEGKQILRPLTDTLADLGTWTTDTILATIRDYANARDLKVGKVFQPLRAALTGTMASPGVGEVAYAFGKDKTLRHIRAVL